MRPTIEPGQRVIRGTLLQNGNFFGDGEARLNMNGTGSFQMTTVLQSLQPNAAHVVRDREGHLWPLDSLLNSSEEDARHYELTHSIDFGEIAIPE
jgi:hypothetical protein